MTRRIAVVTGTRAEYGLLRPLCQAIAASRRSKLQLVVTGMHLEKKFGMTVREIVADRLPIAARLPLGLDDDTPAGIARSMAKGLAGFGACFARIKPDLVVLLGDRFEMLAAAEAAMLARIPIAHIHGGESTEGLIDEAIRHAITKMAQLHFPVTDFYRRRIIQLGEDPKRVFNFGAPVLDTLRTFKPLSRTELAKRFGIVLGSPLIVATFHPVTLEAKDSGRQLRALLSTLDEVPHAAVVITYPNADTEGHGLIPIIQAYAAARSDRVRAVASLGQTGYLSLLNIADLVIGNSSSGLLEAPHFGIPTVDIGSRQRGRLAPKSVVHCEPSRPAIARAIRRALSPAFRRSIRDMRHPYGDGNFAPRVLRILETTPLNEELLKKRFHALSVRE